MGWKQHWQHIGIPVILRNSLLGWNLQSLSLQLNWNEGLWQRDPQRKDFRWLLLGKWLLFLHLPLYFSHSVFAEPKPPASKMHFPAEISPLKELLLKMWFLLEIVAILMRMANGSSRDQNMSLRTHLYMSKNKDQFVKSSAKSRTPLVCLNTAPGNSLAFQRVETPHCHCYVLRSIIPGEGTKIPQAY